MSYSEQRKEFKSEFKSALLQGKNINLTAGGHGSGDCFYPCIQIVTYSDNAIHENLVDRTKMIIKQINYSNDYTLEDAEKMLQNLKKEVLDEMEGFSYKAPRITIA